MVSGMSTTWMMTSLATIRTLHCGKFQTVAELSRQYAERCAQVHQSTRGLQTIVGTYKSRSAHSDSIIKELFTKDLYWQSATIDVVAIAPWLLKSYS